MRTTTFVLGVTCADRVNQVILRHDASAVFQQRKKNNRWLDSGWGEARRGAARRASERSGAEGSGNLIVFFRKDILAG